MAMIEYGNAPWFPEEYHAWLEAHQKRVDEQIGRKTGTISYIEDKNVGITYDRDNKLVMVHGENPFDDEPWDLRS